MENVKIFSSDFNFVLNDMVIVFKFYNTIEWMICLLLLRSGIPISTAIAFHAVKFQRQNF